MEMSRRSFVASAAAAAAVGAAGLVVDVSNAEEAPQDEMTDAEAWEWLMDEPMITEDFIMDDGTVVPAIYVRMQNRINRTGSGCGNMNWNGHVDPERFTVRFDWLMENFTLEEAEAYMMMPNLQWFTAADLDLDVRTEAEWDALCEDLSLRGLLYRVRRAGIAHYHQLAFVHGLFEFGMLHYEEEGYLMKLFGLTGTDDALWMGRTATYHPMPVSKEIVSDPRILPFDDWKAVVARNEWIAVAPCQCRNYQKILGLIDPNCDHPMETCMAFGECAQYYIENGIGRQIDREEAEAILQHSIDCGMIIQSEFTQSNEVLCSCHGDCCGQLLTIRAHNGDLPAMPNYCNYVLDVDTDKCIQCGSCASRCPLFAITMNDEGYPEAGPTCVKCGQCALVCPVSARSLHARPEDDRLPLAEDMLGDYVQKSIDRVKLGVIEDFVY